LLWTNAAALSWLLMPLAVSLWAIGAGLSVSGLMQIGRQRVLGFVGLALAGGCATYLYNWITGWPFA